MKNQKRRIKVKTVVIVADLARSSRRDFLSGFLNATEVNRAWNVQFATSPEMCSDESVENWINGGADGMVILEDWNQRGNLLIEKSRIPVIAVGARENWFEKRNTNIVSLRIDDESIGSYAAEYFQRLGKFNSYVFVSAEKAELWSRARESGFREAVEKTGSTVSIPQDGESVPKLLDRMEKPVAVFAASDQIAAKIMADLGRRVQWIPERISIIGVDDDVLLCHATRPQLTSIRPGHFDEGAVAAREIGNLLNSRRPRPRKTVLCAKMGLSERASSAYISPAAIVMTKAREFIKHNATRGITPDDVAHHLGISRRLLDLRFRELDDRSVSLRIRDTKLEAVRRELVKSDERISVIGRRCGFPNANYLKKIFLSEFAITMGEYRRRRKSSMKHGFSTHTPRLKRSSRL